jgi:hypothetical protein
VNFAARIAGVSGRAINIRPQLNEDPAGDSSWGVQRRLHKIPSFEFKPIIDGSTNVAL